MPMRPRSVFILFGLLAACVGENSDKSGEGTDTGASGAEGSDGGGDDTSAPTLEPVCTEPREMECVDQLILDLSLHDDKVSEGEVSTTTEGADFITFIDASAGGMNGAARNPWVYVKFSADGATRVDIDDETALESMDWDMALRRFIVRLNGGSSGPSCVGAVGFLESSYEDLNAVPEGLEFGYDDYYTDDCTIINDSSGLPDSPQVVMAPWWEYPGCVATTDVPFLVLLADGHVIKLRVEAYYGTGQDECDESGSPGSDSAFYTLRWAVVL
jgi:hypothetical protein